MECGFKWIPRSCSRERGLEKPLALRPRLRDISFGEPEFGERGCKHQAAAPILSNPLPIHLIARPREVLQGALMVSESHFRRTGYGKVGGGLLHWLVPAIDVGGGTLSGVVATGVALLSFGRLMTLAELLEAEEASPTVCRTSVPSSFSSAMTT